MLEVLGNRQMCLARELTKVHEEYIRGTIEEVLEVAATCIGDPFRPHTNRHLHGTGPDFLLRRTPGP